MTKTLIDAIYEHRTMVMKCVMMLESRAHAADQLGMHTLADALLVIASDLDESSKEVQRTHSIDLNKRVIDSEAASIAMLEGVLAGVAIGKEASK